jgi:hypothetical protein
MNTLYWTRVERRDFGDIMSDRGLSRLRFDHAADLDGLPSPAASSLLAVWPQEPKGSAELPAVLICKDGTEEDWAAWITTIAAKIRPFSAYMRLITHSNFRWATKGASVPTLDRLTWAATGVVLGEVLAASHLPDRALDTITAAACASTLAFVMFRAAAMYPTFQQWDRLVKAWESVREMTKQRPRAIEGASVARVCATIIAGAGHHQPYQLLSSKDETAAEGCRSFVETGLPPKAFFSIGKFESTERKMHGPREERVVAFDEYLRELDSVSVTNTELIPFSVGYLASRIAPGTIQHSSVLTPIARRYPSTLLWYGFCAGCGEPETTLPGGNLGRAVDLPASARRVARDLLRREPVVGPPLSDIGFSELVALSRTGKDPFEGLITGTQATATIELAPGVWTSVNVSPKSATTAMVREPRERVVIAALGRQIEQLRRIYMDLVGDEPTMEQDYQQSLFSSRRKKK